MGITNKDKVQLEKWIGAGHKTFELLYSIKRDGCSGTAFHKHCDKKGPTVTVLYTKDDHIYGGYSGVSWGGSNQYTGTNSEFLFLLKLGGKEQFCKFPLNTSKAQNAVYNHADYGPTFGSAHDLMTFKDTVDTTDNKFSLNGRVKIGVTYDADSVYASQLNDSNMTVVELEVYAVMSKERGTDNLPVWRKTGSWDRERLDVLKREITEFRPIAELNINIARIVVIGPVRAGKSSFFNTIDSIFRGRITQRACSGNAEQSLTTSYTPYTVRTPSGTVLNFRLCDTRGLEESNGLDTIECNYLLDGNIPDFYEFNPSVPIKPGSQGFKPTPVESDMVHCAVFVLDSTTMEVISSKLVEKIKSFQELMNRKGIPQIILLTKVDRLCHDVQADVSSVFKSEIVEQHVDKASQLLGFPRANVLPVKNYENEQQLDMNISILALLALRQMLNFAEDFLFNILDRRGDNPINVVSEKTKVEANRHNMTCNIKH